jgi:hypothetical protein
VRCSRPAAAARLLPSPYVGLGACSVRARPPRLQMVLSSLHGVAACARSCARLPARAMGKATSRGVRTACILHDTGVAITARTRVEVGSQAASDSCWAGVCSVTRSDRDLSRHRLGTTLAPLSTYGSACGLTHREKNFIAARADSNRSHSTCPADIAAVQVGRTPGSRPGTAPSPRSPRRGACHRYRARTLRTYSGKPAPARTGGIGSDRSCC